MNHLLSSPLRRAALRMPVRRACLVNVQAMSSTPTEVTLHFVGPDNYKKTIITPPGRNLMKVIKAHHIDYLPCVCNGQIQCSTCHVKLQDDAADNPDDLTSQVTLRMVPPSLEEMDMLDIAADVDNNSRLACQLMITPQMDGATIKIPDHVSNYMDDPSGTAVPTRLLKV